MKIKIQDLDHIFNLFQSILLSTSIAVLCFQLAVAHGYSTHLTPSGIVTRPTVLKGTDGKQTHGPRSLYSETSFKRVNEASTKAFASKNGPTMSFSSEIVVPSKSQLSMSKATVKRKIPTGNATKSSKGPWPNNGIRRVRRQRKRKNNFERRRLRTRKRHKGWKRKTGVKKLMINNNGTGKNDSSYQGNNTIVGNQTSQQPCNSTQAPDIDYKVGKVECRRLQSSELEQEMNCRGMYNHQYLATSFKEALKFKDLDTGRNLDVSKSSFIMNRKPSRRQKRKINIKPGETLIVQCHGGKTPTSSGNLRICPVCMAITRQPSTPRRFPEYINELLCDPKMVSTYLPGIDAFCVQKTFTLDLLQFDGDWELNSALSAEAGHDVYTEKWERYTQTIRRHCACELLPSSHMVTLV